MIVFACVLQLVTSACATPAPRAAAREEPKAVAPPSEPVLERVVDAPPAPPATWQEALDRFGSKCPVPFFTLAQPTQLVAGTTTFTLSGSTLTLELLT